WQPESARTANRAVRLRFMARATIASLGPGSSRKLGAPWRFPLHKARPFPHARPSMFLAGDIGGTKTNLAVYAYHDGQLCMQKNASFSSKSHCTLVEIVREFLG